jgi:hypothetical protein
MRNVPFITVLYQHRGILPLFEVDKEKVKVAKQVVGRPE